MRIQTLVIGAMLVLSPVAAQAAATCDEFKAAMIEDAKHHEVPPPTFRLEHVNEADANIQYFRISDTRHRPLTGTHGSSLPDRKAAKTLLDACQKECAPATGRFCG
jgi:hypothetical protein